MIGRLAGTIIEKQAPNLLLDVHGVGYELQAPMTTFFQLPDIEESVVLHTHFLVSETSQQLFGFMNHSDRKLFRLLIRVSGVGPKMAIGIMSMSVNDFVSCVMAEDVSALVKVPGVGKKTAERLIVEMRDKLSHWSQNDGAKRDHHALRQGNQFIVEEAESALIALGYKPAEAAKAVSSAMAEDINSSEALIRYALRRMLPR